MEREHILQVPCIDTAILTCENSDLCGEVDGGRARRLECARKARVPAVIPVECVLLL